MVILLTANTQIAVEKRKPRGNFRLTLGRLVLWIARCWLYEVRTVQFGMFYTICCSHCVCRGVWFQPEGETASHHWLCCCRRCFSHLSHRARHRLQPVSYPKSALDRLHTIYNSDCFMQSHILCLVAHIFLVCPRRGSDRPESEFTDKLQHYTSGHCK